MDIENHATAPATEAEMQAILSQSEFAQYVDTDQVRHPLTGRIMSKPGTNNGDGGDEQLTVEFTTEAVFNKLLTFRAGGVTKYSDMDFITITTPGDNKVVVHTPVTEYHQWRFPNEYQAFKKGQGALLNGTPLNVWPLLTQSQIRELTTLNIRTVEQVAGLSDSNAGQFSGFYSLKLKAQQFLELATDKAAQGKLQAELDQRDKEHKNQLAAMQAQMDSLLAMMQSKADEADAPKVVEKAAKTK